MAMARYGHRGNGALAQRLPSGSWARMKFVGSEVDLESPDFVVESIF